MAPPNKEQAEGGSAPGNHITPVVNGSY